MRWRPLSAGGHTVSWDHFFTSLTHYYASLREQVTSAAPDMVYRHQPKAITPHEIDGIVSMLRLVQVVAKQVGATRRQHRRPARGRAAGGRF